MPAANRLTDRAVRLAKPTDKEQALADGAGLWLRVQPAHKGGAKSWYYRYSYNGKPKRLALGAYPAVSLAEAREACAARRRVLARGIDPATVRAGEGGTLRELVDDWMAAVVVRSRKDGGAKLRRQLDADVLAGFGQMAVSSISVQNVAAWVGAVAARGAAQAAGRLLTDIKRMLDWAARTGRIEYNPAALLKPRDFGAALGASRDRNLQFAEIAELARQMPAADLSERNQALLWMLLATGVRTQELRLARVSEFDIDAREWRIPAEHVKTGIAHVVHLSQFALHQLDVLMRSAVGGLLVPGRGGRAPVSDHYIRTMVGRRVDKRRLDRRRNEALGSLLLQGGPWTPHDLRRTMSSRMRQLGVDYDVVEACLNHVNNTVGGVYQRYDFMHERRAAFDVWGQALAALSMGPWPQSIDRSTSDASASTSRSA